ncbi:MAG: 4Fe-4S ferredoxin, partial [Deltaproteobacteria bacterium]|nr:4Fe-4S ferredoxin [Deltaproteobacteria bacterium]
MVSYIDKIKEISKQLLEEGRVEMVIGFRKGTVPMMNEPYFAKTPEAVEHFVWDSNCGINLCNYLTNRTEKIGIVAKGCDSRNIVTHIIENKIKRDQLVIIGVPCKGMIDRRKISAMFEAEIGEVIEDGNTITVKGADFEETIDKKDVLQQNCAVCIHRNPVIHDELVADPIQEQTDVDRYADVREIEALSPQEKAAYFEKLLE